MRTLEPPVTPGADEARTWLEEELSRAEYSSELSPLTRFFRQIIQAIMDAMSGGTHHFSTSTVLIIIFSLALIVALIVVLTNPIRTAKNTSHDVFDEEVTSLEDAMHAAQNAARSKQWDQAIVWEFRTLVLRLDLLNALVVGPGLTAKEATDKAAVFRPAWTSRWHEVRDIFDAVRYGTVEANEEQWAAIHAVSVDLNSEVTVQ